VWSGNPDEIQAYQNLGFQTVTLASTDLMTSLQGGMVDALVTSPLVAASSQWFGIAGNMSALKLGPLWGAAIVSTKTWAEVPVEMQPKLIEAAQKIFDSLLPDLLKADGEAVAVMQKYGLQIHAVTPQTMAAWVGVFSKTFPGLVGKMYDRDSFLMAKKYLDEYLAMHPR
jgi:TRAP-type C4-dicarboxylate transport system substrate-binding protein